MIVPIVNDIKCPCGGDLQLMSDLEPTVFDPLGLVNHTKCRSCGRDIMLSDKALEPKIV